MGKKRILTVMAALAAILPSAASADISGHTVLSQGGFGGWTGTNNWAVLDPGSALRAALTAIGFTAGTGSAGWATVLPTDYIYLYQETNDASSSTGLANFTNSLGLPGNDSPTSPTVWGQFGGLVMQDAQGNISATNNLNAGGLSGIVASGGLNDAIDISLGPAGSPSSFLARWTSAGAGTVLAQGETGSLFVFVSPYAPATFTGSLQNGGNAVAGASPAPAAIPAPGAAVLGLMGLASLVARRRSA